MLFYTSYFVLYIGKTERTIFERIIEHALKDKHSVVYSNTNKCDEVKYLDDLLNTDQVQTERDKLDKKICSVTAVIESINTIDRARRWDILLFKKDFI